MPINLLHSAIIGTMTTSVRIVSASTSSRLQPMTARKDRCCSGSTAAVQQRQRDRTIRLQRRELRPVGERCLLLHQPPPGSSGFLQSCRRGRRKIRRVRKCRHAGHCVCPRMGSPQPTSGATLATSPSWGSPVAARKSASLPPCLRPKDCPESRGVERGVPQTRRQAFSAKLGATVLKESGLNATELDKLQAMPWRDFYAIATRAQQQAAREAGPGSGMMRGFSPVADGNLLPSHPYDPEAAPTAADGP